MDKTAKVSKLFPKLWEALHDPKIRGIVLEGGSRSSKTWTIAQALYLISGEDTVRIAIGRLRRTWIKSTVLDTFKKALVQMEEWDNTNLNKTDLVYRNQESTIEFYGLDDAQKLHGVETDYFWLNEAIEIRRDDFDQLEQRCKKKWILDYNPTTDEHWIYDNVLKRDDVIMIHSTMFDNPFLPQAIIDKIKSYEPTPKNIGQATADLHKWTVYGLGKRSRREGAIFDNWTETNEWPEDFKWRALGLDFGYTNDPTALIDVRLQGGKIWCKELIFETSLTNQDISLKMAELKHIETIADSAEPKSIEELSRLNHNIRGVVKGADSINNGINKLKQYPIMVHQDSLNLIKELKNYSWKKDFKTNKATNSPMDDFNHGIDALRYVAMMKLGVHTGEYNFV